MSFKETGKPPAEDTNHFTYKYSLVCRPQCFFKWRHCYFTFL